MGRRKRTSFPRIPVGAKARHKDKSKDKRHEDNDLSLASQLFLPTNDRNTLRHSSLPHLASTKESPLLLSLGKEKEKEKQRGDGKGKGKGKRRRTGGMKAQRFRKDALERGIKGAVLTERALFRRLEKKMEAVRDSLPMEFLTQAEFRIHGIDRALNACSRLYTSQRETVLKTAMNRWLQFTRKERQLEQKWVNGIQLLWRLCERFVLRCRQRVWTRLTRIAKQCSICERLAAVVEIQKVWRGCVERSEHATRLGWRLWRMSCPTSDDEAARRIQKAFRACVRRTTARLDVAATRLQCLWRSRAAKRTTERFKKEYETQRERDRTHAALLMQRAFRSHVTRKIQVTAARRIQGTYRRHRTWQLQALLMHLNACKIQSFWRLTASKKLLNHLRKQHVLSLLATATAAAEESAAAVTIQLVWRRHRSRLFYDMSEIAARQAIHDAERWTMALRIQNAFRQHQIKRMLGLTCEQLSHNLDTSATVISSSFRGWIVRLYAARDKSRAVRIADASITMQSFARGWLAKAQLSKLQEEWTAEQHEQKLTVFRMLQLFQRWRRYTLAEIHERERASTTRAVAHYNRNLLTKSWATLRHQLAEYRRQRQLLARAIGHSRHRVKSRAVNAWRGLANLALWRRGYLVKIFLACIELDAYNSTPMLRQVTAATRHHTLKLLRGSFDVLDHVKRRAALKLEKAIAWHVSRWNARTPRLVFKTWRVRAKQFKCSRLAKAIANGAVTKLSKRRALRQLTRYAHDRMTARKHNAIARSHSHWLRQRRGVTRWSRYVRLQRRQRQEALLRVQSYERQQYRLAWTRWRAWQEALRRHNLTTLRQALRAWWALANRAKAARQVETSTRLLQEYKQYRQEESERQAAANAPLPRLPVSCIDDILSTRVPCLVLATTPWELPTTFQRLEARLTLLLLRQPLPLYVRVHRIEYTPALNTQLTQLGFKKLPSMLITWKGQSLRVWAEQHGATWRGVFEDISMALKKSIEHDTDEALQDLFQAMRGVLEIETSAVRRLQRAWHERRGRVGVGRWREGTTVALLRKTAEEQAWHWLCSSWNEYGSSREGDQTSRFWFNHKTGESRWEQPEVEEEEEDPELNVYVIASTGYRKPLHLRSSYTMGQLKQDLAKILRVQADHQRVCIRPEGVDHAGRVITGVNNRRMHARMGRGMDAEVLDGTEWVPARVVRVYEDQSVDAQAHDSDSLFKCARVDVRLVEHINDSATLGQVAEEGTVIEASVSWQDDPIPDTQQDHCIQCTDCATRPATWYCQQCHTVSCEPCFLSQHDLPIDMALDLDPQQRWKAGHRAIPVDTREIATDLLQHGYDAEVYGYCISCSVRRVTNGNSRCDCCLPPTAITASTSNQDAQDTSTGSSLTLSGVVTRWNTPHWRRVKAQQAAMEAEKDAAEKEATRQFLTEAFNRHDVDGNGTMDKSELHNFLQNELCEPISAKELRDALEEMDENGDGVIELEELITWFTRLRRDTSREGFKTRLLRRELQLRKLAKRATERATLKASAVPGRPAIPKISLDDYDTMLPRFKRFIRNEHGVTKAIFSNEERSQQVFDSLYVRAWNTGKLSNVYYHDKKEIKADGLTYLQLWDDKHAAFKFVNASDSAKILWTNPQLEPQHRTLLRPIFDQYDTHATGALDEAQVKALLREEMSADLTDDEIQQAFTRMQSLQRLTSTTPHANKPKDEATVTFEPFLSWYAQGVELTEPGQKKRFKLAGTLSLTGSRLSKTFSKHSSIGISKRSSLIF